MGFIAQGSEFGFGKPYARGINDEALCSGEDKYLQVVSCNTHNISVLIKTPGPDERRRTTWSRAASSACGAPTTSARTGSCPAPRWARTRTPFGTHHARDAWHLFQTLGWT